VSCGTRGSGQKEEGKKKEPNNWKKKHEMHDVKTGPHPLIIEQAILRRKREEGGSTEDKTGRGEDSETKPVSNLTVHSAINQRKTEGRRRMAI